MTRKDFYETGEMMDRAKNIVRALEVIDLHLLGRNNEGTVRFFDKKDEEKWKEVDVSGMISGLFLDDDERSVTKLLRADYHLYDLLLMNGKEIKIGDKNLLEVVKERSLAAFAPEEMFIARDKFLTNLKKALEEVLASIELPQPEENTAAKN